MVPPRRRWAFRLLARACAAASVSGTVLALGVCDPAAANTPSASRYTIVPGSYTPQPSFVVTYDGSGSWRTVYHSEPPDPGGAHDTNDAHDSSTEHWSLRFTQPLAITRCG